MPVCASTTANKNAMVACEDQPPRSGLVQLSDAANGPNTAHPYRHSAKEIDTFAVGEATGTSRNVRPVELATRPSPFDPSGAPDFLRDYLTHIVAIPNIDVSVLTESHDDGWSIPIDAMQSDSREVDPRLFIRVNKKMKIRRASVFLLQSPYRPAGHLTIIEGKTACGYFALDSLNGEESITNVLQSSALKFITEPVPSIASVLKEIRAAFRTA